MPGGRPTELTPEIVAEVRRLLPAALYTETVIHLLGIHKATFYRWLKRGAQEKDGLYREFCDSIKKGLAEGQIRDLEAIRRAAENGIWQAAAWRLERRYPERWG